MVRFDMLWERGGWLLVCGVRWLRYYEYGKAKKRGQMMHHVMQ